MFSSRFMLFPTFKKLSFWCKKILEKIILGIKQIDLIVIFFRKTILFHLMFSSCFFFYAISITNIFRIFGNIEKCPFTYWLNGRWFPQIVYPPIGTVGIYIEYI